MVLHIIAWRFALLFIGDISIQKCVTFFKIMDIYVYSNWSDIIYSAAPKFYWITVLHPGLQSPAHHKSRQDCTLCCVFTAPYTIRTTKMLTARGKAFLAKATYRVSLAIKKTCMNVLFTSASCQFSLYWLQINVYTILDSRKWKGTVCSPGSITWGVL